MPFEKNLRITITRLTNGWLIEYNNPINGKIEMYYCENENYLCEFIKNKIKLVGK